MDWPMSSWLPRQPEQSFLEKLRTSGFWGKMPLSGSRIALYIFSSLLEVDSIIKFSLYYIWNTRKHKNHWVLLKLGDTGERCIQLYMYVYIFTYNYLNKISIGLVTAKNLLVSYKVNIHSSFFTNKLFFTSE